MAALVDVATKREAAVAAKGPPYHDNWVKMTPPSYYKQLTEIRESRTQLTPEEKATRSLKDLRRNFIIAARGIFRIADVDGSKSLDIDELKRIDEAKAQDLMDLLDADKSGHITIDEWLLFTSKVYDTRGADIAFGLLDKVEGALFERQVQDLADLLFDLFDRDKSDTLDLSEVSVMFPVAPAQASRRSGRRRGVMTDEAWEFLNFVDEDANGMLDRGEWREFIKQGWKMTPRAAVNFCNHLIEVARAHGYDK